MVEIREAVSKRDKKRFLTFPDRLYEDCPYYVPGFKSDDRDDWDKKKNPAFSDADAKCFLALRDGEVVGRIALIHSHAANRKWGESRLRFTAFDFIDDEEVSRALLDTAEAYAREQGLTEIHGPLGFSDLDREGMLIEGFEQKSLFFTNYNFPYYAEHMVRAGYEKSVDWIELRLERPQADAPALRVLEKLSDRALRRHGLTVLKVKHNREYKPYIQRAFTLVNLAYGELYGTVPLNDAQIRRYAAKFVPLVDPDFACVVLDGAGEMVAFGATAPCLSDAMRKTGGRLFPFGWVPVLKALKKPKQLDFLLIAVHPEWRGKGVNAVIMHHVLSGAWRRGLTCAETGPQLEYNADVLSQWSAFPHTQHKRRRCFIKRL